MAGSGRIIDDFSDEVIYDFLEYSPDLAAVLGISRIGDRALSADRLPDFSDDGAAFRKEIVRKHASTLETYDQSTLSGEQRVTARVLDFVLNEGFYESFPGTAGHHLLDKPYPLTHLDGPHSALVSLLARDHVILNESDAEAFLSRLESAGSLFAGVGEALGHRARNDVSVPSRSLEIAIDDLRQFCAVEAADNILVCSMQAKVSATMSVEKSEHFRVAAEQLVREVIYPACTALIAQARSFLAREESAFGAWALPDGDEWYQWQLRGHTTTALSPEEVHRLGMEGITQLHEEIRSQFAAHDIEGGTIASLYQRAGKQTSGEAAGSATRTRPEILSEARSIVTKMQDQIRPMFDLWPGKGVEIEPVPDILEQSHHSYYVPPSMDGQRAGNFVINLSQLQMMSSSELATLCHHEAYPGHHLQLTVAQEREELPVFRRAMLFAAYLEGWAKYSELLPIEEGLVDDPMLILGRLRSELYSTTNLALDTGIHHFRWSREQALNFVRDNTGANADFAQVIVDRCSVTPGQLCAYKTGMISVINLLNKFKEVRGADFDRREFHNAVLRHGPLPLPIFEELGAVALR